MSNFKRKHINTGKNTVLIKLFNAVFKCEVRTSGVLLLIAQNWNKLPQTIPKYHLIFS